MGNIKNYIRQSCFILCFILTCLLNTSADASGVRIVLIETMPVPAVLEHSKWFVKQLEELGYHDGKTLDLTIIKADGDRGKADKKLREELGKKRPDLVATSATLASQIARSLLKDTGIPQVFFTVSDPVGAGLIQKIGAPTGKNITGIVHMVDRRTRINMVMRLQKSCSQKKPARIGFIHSSYPSAKGDLKQLQMEAGNTGNIVFEPYEIEYIPHDTDTMLKEVEKGVKSLEALVSCWWEPSGPLGEINAYTRTIIKNSKHPIVMGTKLNSVKSGALLHLTPGIESTGREAALIADAILKGQDPGKISVRRPQTVDLGINLTTAVKMKIVIPPDILTLAGENVFR